MQTLGPSCPIGTFLHVSIRPEDTCYSKEPIPGFQLIGKVKDIIYVGSIIKTLVQLPDGNEVKISRLQTDSSLQEGDTVYIYWALEDSVIIESKDNPIFEAITQNKIENILN